MPWIRIDGKPAYRPEAYGGHDGNPDGTPFTEWQRASGWAAERCNARRHITIRLYRLAVAARELNKRKRDLRKKLGSASPDDETPGAATPRETWSDLLARIWDFDHERDLRGQVHGDDQIPGTDPD